MSSDVIECNPKKKGYVDPWLLVCGLCPLPDCVRIEGEMQTRGASFRSKQIDQCPVYRASERGWNAYEAIENRDVLGLLVDVDDWKTKEEETK